MKIIKVECIPVTLPMKKPQLTRDETRKSKDNVVVKVHTDEGIIGIGESGVPNTRRGDTVEGVMGTIKIVGSSILLGEDPFNIEMIVAKMERRVKGSNPAKAAIDMALYDIVGKTLGVPVYKLLGGLTYGKIPYCAMAHNRPTPNKVAESAAKALESGCYGVKYHFAKGVTFEEDLANVKAIREAIGPDGLFFACVNEGWDYHQALDSMKKLEKFNLLHIEQPVPWWDFASLARLHEHQDIPIWADESVQEPSQVLQLIQMDAVDGLFFKVTCVGGLLKSLKWVSVCQAAGLPATLGSMGGSAITAAAQLHFLAANEWMGNRPFHGNISFLGLHDAFDTVSKPIDDLVINVPRYEKGYMYVPEAPGLGVEINEEHLSQWVIPGMSQIEIRR